MHKNVSVSSLSGLLSNEVHLRQESLVKFCLVICGKYVDQVITTHS